MAKRREAINPNLVQTLIFWYCPGIDEAIYDTLQKRKVLVRVIVDFKGRFIDNSKTL